MAKRRSEDIFREMQAAKDALETVRSLDPNDTAGIAAIESRLKELRNELATKP